MARADQVRKQLETILASRHFAKAERLRDLLSYLVERKLAGEEHLIKEAVLAIDVFRRRPDYDPNVDSVVRVTAGKLRSRLAEYYVAEGAGDDLVIELPK